jgi:hypothetical protein
MVDELEILPGVPEALDGEPAMTRVADLKVKIFAYGAAKVVMLDTLGCQVITVTQRHLEETAAGGLRPQPLFARDREYVPARDAVEAGLSPGS